MFTIKKQNALILTIVGTIVAILCFVLIILGILESVARSQYQDLTVNFPVVILLAVGVIAGADATVVGIKKLKSAK